jgi:hypothetical protein
MIFTIENKLFWVFVWYTPEMFMSDLDMLNHFRIIKLYWFNRRYYIISALFPSKALKPAQAGIVDLQTRKKLHLS